MDILYQEHINWVYVLLLRHKPFSRYDILLDSEGDPHLEHTAFLTALFKLAQLTRLYVTFHLPRMIILTTGVWVLREARVSR